MPFAVNFQSLFFAAKNCLLRQIKKKKRKCWNIRLRRQHFKALDVCIARKREHTPTKLCMDMNTNTHTFTQSHRSTTDLVHQSCSFNFQHQTNVTNPLWRYNSNSLNWQPRYPTNNALCELFHLGLDTNNSLPPSSQMSLELMGFSNI